MKSTLKKRVMAAALTLTLCVLCLAPVSALSGSYDQVKGQDCTLTVEYAPRGEAMVGVNFRIWHVGTLSEKGCLPFQEFGTYNVLNGSGDWVPKAGTLLSYLQRDKVAPKAEDKTNEEGKVTFEIAAADQGLYLVAGDSQYRGGTRYDPTPFLIMVPYTKDLQTWELGVDANMEVHEKYTTYTPSSPGPDTPATVDRHVLKSWEDDGYEEERPASITVDLLRDGQVYDTVTLTAAGSWRYDWTGLDARSTWTVAERENEQYSVLVEREGITFHITNTWQEEIDPEDPPLIDLPDDPNVPKDPDPNDPEIDIGDEDPPLADLPQTGQLWWPVTPLAMGGVLLLLIGWKQRRDWSRSHER